ncbi:hypothetical protein GE21DRAFT_1065882 [Neurospora crassa]|nr:hypothetical protein GE21DRAFT_1065882 [Neurospora crassa]
MHHVRNPPSSHQCERSSCQFSPQPTGQSDQHRTLLYFACLLVTVRKWNLQSRFPKNNSTHSRTIRSRSDLVLFQVNHKGKKDLFFFPFFSTWPFFFSRLFFFFFFFFFFPFCPSSCLFKLSFWFSSFSCLRSTRPKTAQKQPH